MKSGTERDSRRQLWARRLLFRVLAVVCLVAAWYWSGDWVGVRYHFWRLVAPERPCRHRYCRDYCYEHIWALGARGDIGIRYLERKVTGGSNEEKAAALEALTQLGLGEVVDYGYAGRLVNSEDPVVGFYAAVALRAFRTDKSTAGLRKCLDSDQLLVFATGVSGLLRRKPTDLDELMAKALERTDPLLRSGILRRLEGDALWRREQPRPGARTAEVLRTLAQSAPDPQHRRTAAEILKHMNALQKPDPGTKKAPREKTGRRKTPED